MGETIATTDEIKKDFDKYLEMVINGNEVIVTKNGKEVGRFIPSIQSNSYPLDSLKGIIKGDYDLKEEKMKRIERKYKIFDRNEEKPI